jgi:DNA-binding beta-propeller fold protein YncE
MPRGNFTTIIDVKTGAVSRLANGASNHIAIRVPGTNLMVLTQSTGTIRIADWQSDKVLADLPGGRNPNSAVYDPVTKFVFVMNKESGDAAVVDPVARRVVETIAISPSVLEFPVTDGAGMKFRALRCQNCLSQND